MSESVYHIFTKPADARQEVEELVQRLGGEAGESGFHKMIFVTRANQTVVFVTHRHTPLAAALRQSSGWQEPEQ